MSCESALLPIGPMARRLRVPVRWLRAEAEAGRIPHVRAERVLLFDPEAVERVLLERAQRPATQAVIRSADPPRLDSEPNETGGPGPAARFDFSTR